MAVRRRRRRGVGGSSNLTVSGRRFVGGIVRSTGRVDTQGHVDVPVHR
jgi:hypothetical protein